MTKILTYEARKSTPTDLGSCKKVRECKSVAKTICTKQEFINIKLKYMLKMARQLC